MLTTEQPRVEELEQACEKAGAALLKTAGILQERRETNDSKIDECWSFEREWEGIEEIAHDLLKALAVFTSKVK